MKKIGFVVVCIMFIQLSASAQVNYSEYMESGEPSSYKKQAPPEREVVNYPYLREADVKYYKRIIRCIDSRQKMNKVIEWPKNPLNKILYDNVLSGTFKAYKNDSLYNTSFYTPEDMAKRGGSEEVLQIPTEFEGEFRDSVINNPFDYETIKRYWIMEDWIFDYKHSVFKPRIIAIAPIFQPKFGGLQLPDQPWCWIQMDNSLRGLLLKSELFNTYNDAARLSYDDFFQMRMFDSYIVKESNVFDYKIREFEEFSNDGVAALLESDRVKNDLFIFEHDLWQY